MVSRREFYVSLLLVALAGAWLGAAWKAGTPAGRSLVRAAEAQMLAAKPFTFAAVARRATPPVVNIFTTQRVRVTPFGQGDPFDQFFRQFFPELPREMEQKSLGSGVIIDREGNILTNHHVVANADEIQVKLADTRSFPAELVGSDARTDVALIRIRGKNLPQAELGDSDELGVGDWVLAIGNPFGLEETVTAGIVSAKERVIGAGPFDNFIQTDASINPGNSGGPLVDIDGKVVGLNSAIFSRSGGSIGIGFAIPINLAIQVVDQLRAHRRVVRGWLGVVMQDVTPDLARSFGLPSEQGALVSDIYRGGPAHRAGIRRGDVIVGFDGRPVKNSRELSRWAAEVPLGHSVKIDVVRGGVRRSFDAVIQEAPAERGA
ncbi:MAG: Do family serine endopeptidase [Deltaproteobacteria bacterium]|nr:Do family serine endopeptidase [Deltaproteobacteria bacterium]